MHNDTEYMMILVKEVIYMSYSIYNIGLIEEFGKDKQIRRRIAKLKLQSINKILGDLTSFRI